MCASLHRSPARITPRLACSLLQAFVLGHHVCVAPVVIPITCGILCSADTAAVCSDGPCISTDGRLYVPWDDKVSVFDAEGSELPSITAASVGMSEGVSTVHSRTADTPQLLLGSSDSGLVAVDPSTLAVRWSIRDLSVRGIAPLSTQGIVVVATNTGLRAFRLLDGAFVGRVSDDTAYHPCSR